VAVDLYIRVSQLGDRNEEEATESYELMCREAASRAKLAVAEVVYDTDESGSTPVAKRKLERLVQRVEDGESEGVITPYVDRWGRSLVEGSLAYKRIDDAGGRLICAGDGIDSSRDGTTMQFHMRLAVAEDFLERNRANRLAAIDRAIERGAYLAPTPFGYRKDTEGGLIVVERERKVVLKLYTRRAEGASVADLTRETKLPGSRIRSILANRVYLGEMRVQTKRKGQVRTLTNYHAPILTERQWQAAQRKGEYHARDGSIAAETPLAGKVYCGTCGKRCRGGKATHERKDGTVVERYTYVCTNRGCSAHAGVQAETLDEWVREQFWLHADDPAIEAVARGHTEYHDALDEVERRQRLHDEFRDDLDAQEELGMKDFMAALRIRREALELARRELAAMRPPRKPKRQRTALDEELGTVDDHALFDLFVHRVIIHPADRHTGRTAIPIAERAQVFFVGQEAEAAA
jgi:DNA invertase Pin-like site-specific DNA recombinase